MARDFDTWFSTFIANINRYDYYVNADNVFHNTQINKDAINKLNCLCGSKNIENDFKNLLNREPDVLVAIPQLLAVRYEQIHCEDNNGVFDYDFKNSNQSVDQYVYFMRKTGLFEILQRNNISNLSDYLVGVQVGLDTNGRKNRGGKQMEDLVEHYIIEAGYILNNTYFKQYKIEMVEKQFNVDLSALKSKSKYTKKFDFVIKSASKIYLVETNFYAGGGSKLNETAGAYERIAEKTDKISDVEFMWITDGSGWETSKPNLQKSFEVIDHLYNINDMKMGILKQLK